MSSKSNGNGGAAENQNKRPDTKRSESSDSTEEREPGGFPAVGKAIEPFTQPVNYAIKGTTRAVNGTLGITTGVANGLVYGITSGIGHAAEATFPKGAFLLSPACYTFNNSRTYVLQYR
jgi:hypothetical protein